MSKLNQPLSQDVILIRFINSPESFASPLENSPEGKEPRSTVWTSAWSIQASARPIDASATDATSKKFSGAQAEVVIAKLLNLQNDSLAIY